jgi:hypothetical protein
VSARSRMRPRGIAGCAVAALGASFATLAAPPTAAELARICAHAEDQAHCGRLVEAPRLGPLKAIVTREGDALRVELLPAGSTVFRDAIDIIGARSYAVWDYVEDLEAIVLFATRGDRTEFWWVQRRGGGEFRLPSEPVLAPGHRRFATADFCAEGCANEIAIWRVDADDVRKELAFAPQEAWSDAGVTWKNADTVAIEYTPASATTPRTLERRLTDSTWTRVR